MVTILHNRLTHFYQNFGSYLFTAIRFSLSYFTTDNFQTTFFDSVFETVFRSFSLFVTDQALQSTVVLLFELYIIFMLMIVFMGPHSIAPEGNLNLE